MTGARKVESAILLAVTLTAAAIWFFPLYWAFVTSIRFPGRRLLYLVVLASFMVPSQALVVSQFILMTTWGSSTHGLGSFCRS